MLSVWIFFCYFLRFHCLEFINRLLVLWFIKTFYREAALLAAAQTPLFSNMSGGKGYTEREKYPYVFDAHAEAKQSSAFIGGAKVCSFT